MMLRILKGFLALAVICCCLPALGATLTVTSPSDNDILGLNNTISFNTSGTVRAVTINVTLVGPGGTITKSQVFSGIDKGVVNGTVALNLNTSTVEGDYTLTVSATESGNSYNTVDPIPVKVDVTAPKFLDFSPADGGFVKGTVPIKFQIEEANLKQWTVTVNDNDIPNNSGTSLNGTVNWDTSSASTDGAQTVRITLTDKGGNTSTRSMTLTVDRIKPIVSIQNPRSDLPIPPGANTSVVIDIQDASSNSVVFTGVDVVIKTTDNTFLLRVPRVSFRALSGTTSRWTGRLRSRIRLPRTCKLVVTCFDRAGNAATTQEVTLTIG